MIGECQINEAKAEQEKRWLEDNKDALAAYNQRVSSHGLLSDEAGLI